MKAADLLAHLPVACLAANAELRLLDANAPCQEMLGLEPEFRGIYLAELQPPQLGIELSRVCASNRPEDLGRPVEIEFYDVDGQPKALSCTVSAIEGGVKLVCLTDVSQQRRQLQRSKLLAMVAQHAVNAVLITDANENIVFANPAFLELSGYTLGELMGRRPPTIVQGPDSSLVARNELRRAIKAREPVKVEILNYRKNGTPYWIAIAVTPVFDERGQLTNFIAIQEDITARRELERQVREQLARTEEYAEALEKNHMELRAANLRLTSIASTDAMTGLWNYRRFRQVVEQEFAYAQTAGASLSVCVLDVDRFKNYNDANGHLAGDEALRQLGQLLKENSRSGDFVARYGGEEFVLLLPKADAAEAMRIAERLRSAVENFDWPLQPLTISIGVATLTDHDALEALIDAADRALYASKDAGRNRATHAGSERRVA